MAKRRKELEKLAVQYPEMFIGHKLIPTIIRRERSGKIWYRGINADAAAVKGRTKGDSLAKILLSDNNDNYACVSTEQRYGAPEELSDQWDGPDSVSRPITDEMGATESKRSVIRTLEGEIAEMLLTGTANAETSFLGGIRKAVRALRRVKGTAVLAISEQLFEFVADLPEVQERFKSVIAASAGNRDVLGLKPAHLENIIDMPIMVGDNEIWYDADHLTGVPQTDAQTLIRDRCVVVKVPNFKRDGIPEISESSLMKSPYFGVNMQSNPGAKNTPFVIKSYFDDDDKTYVYDATGYNELKELNASGRYTMSGISGLS